MTFFRSGCEPGFAHGGWDGVAGVGVGWWKSLRSSALPLCWLGGGGERAGRRLGMARTRIGPQARGSKNPDDAPLIRSMLAAAPVDREDKYPKPFLFANLPSSLEVLSRVFPRRS